MAVVALPYIDVDEHGVARIAGSRSRVSQIVIETQQGMSPQDIHDAHSHLSLAQIFAALAFYHDHVTEIDTEIRNGQELVEKMRREAGEHPFVTRMKTEGKLP